MTYIGVDGCKYGWFYVRSSGADLDFGIVEYLGELLANTPDDARIMVDIPIGLRDDSSTPRQCDTAARKVLGRKRASSVFPAPIRMILNEPTYAEASSKSHRLTGKRISQQTLVTAMAPHDSLRTLPDNPELDSQGLLMEMVYCPGGPIVAMCAT